jgi:hypothetical protein
MYGVRFGNKLTKFMEGFVRMYVKSPDFKDI